MCGYKRKGNIGFLVSVVSQKLIRIAIQNRARDLGARPRVAGSGRGSRTEGWSDLVARPRAAALPRAARSRGLLWAALCSSWLEDKRILIICPTYVCFFKLTKWFHSSLVVYKRKERQRWSRKKAKYCKNHCMPLLMKPYFLSLILFYFRCTSIKKLSSPLRKIF